MSARARLVAAFLAVYLIWGSTYLAIRFAIETLPPFLMAGVRFLLAGAILVAWAALAGAPRPARAELAGPSVVGALLIFGGNGGVVWAEQVVPSGLTALLIATVPLWMALIDWARPDGRRPNVGVAAGLALGFAGVGVLVVPGELGGRHVDPAGAAALVFAALAWATGSIYARHARMPRSPLLATGIEMVAGAALLLVAGTLLGEWAQMDASAVSSRSALAILYLIGFGSLVGFTSYLFLLRATTAARASTYAYVNPVVAILLGWALGGEPLTPRAIVAATVIVAAVALITTRGREEPTAEVA